MLFFSLWDLHHYFLIPGMCIEHFLCAISGMGRDREHRGAPWGGSLLGFV